MEIHNDINLKYVVQSQEVPSLIKLDVGKKIRISLMKLTDCTRQKVDIGTGEQIAK
jgi:hypothetical protein